MLGAELRAPRRGRVRGRRRSGPGCRRSGRARGCRSRRRAGCGTPTRTVVGRRPPLQHLEQARLEALRAERDAVDSVLAQERGEGGRDRLRVRLDGQLLRSAAARRAGARAAAGSVKVGVPPPRKTVSGRSREQVPLERELREQRVDVRAVLVARAAENGDEVAVAAPVRAERQVHVEVLRERRSPVQPPWGEARGPLPERYAGTRHACATASCQLRADCSPGGSSVVLEVEDGEEGLLRHLDPADLLHPLLALLLLLEQLPLAA